MLKLLAFPTDQASVEACPRVMVAGVAVNDAMTGKTLTEIVAVALLVESARLVATTWKVALLPLREEGAV